MLTKQEMFDRAYRGLASQGWRAALSGSACAYVGMEGMRCAWGWVDLSLTEIHRGTVEDLRNAKIGLAANLDFDDLAFASDLQRCHDESKDGDGMRSDFNAMALRYGLTIPVLP
jgi:hypothetical protein